MRPHLPSLVLLLLTGAPAMAAPGELRLGMGAGLNQLAYQRRDVGPGGALLFGYGVGEQLDIELEASYFLHDSGADARGEGDDAIDVIRLTPAIVAKLDIVRWVPSVGLGAGWLSIRDKETLNVLEVTGVFALDYLYSRALSFGARYRVGVTSHGDLEPPFRTALLTATFNMGR
jgi:hypothetical protein